MKIFDASLTKNNILHCIRYSGISDEDFANIIGISIRKFKYIKAEEFSLTINDIEKASAFFKISFDKITTTEISLNKNYRAILLDYHYSNLEYKKILQDKPSIPYAIEFILIASQEFLNKKMEVKAIKAIIENNGYVYTSSSLTNELQKSEFIEFEPHPTKKGTFVYSKKK